VECNGQKTIAGFADALSDWMTAIGLDQAVLVGHSMGGAIALSMALRAPQRVLGLGCFGTATQFRVNSVLIEAAANPDSYQQAINQIVAWSFAPTAPKRLVELAGLRMKATRPDQLYADLLACQAFDIRQQIARVSAPALVLCGEQDKMTPLHYSQALAGALPNSRLVVIEGAGHMVMLERPQAVAKALTEFLQEI
jgi:pimeloyl-ACP methyl ester carboxylesterase